MTEHADYGQYIFYIREAEQSRRHHEDHRDAAHQENHSELFQFELN